MKYGIYEVKSIYSIKQLSATENNYYNKMILSSIITINMIAKIVIHSLASIT